MPITEPLVVSDLGCCEYAAVLQKMQHFTQQRHADTVDELWYVEHPQVFTQGVSGRAEHVLDAHGIPVVRSNRGGQVTYHGPGQIVAYVLFDLSRKRLGVRQLVTLLETAVIELLSHYAIAASARADAPGVYVAGRKVAALGLRVSRGCSYHGLSLNVDMDLQPFEWINPCGYPGQAVTQLRDLGITASIAAIKQQLLTILAANIGYTVTI